MKKQTTIRLGMPELSMGGLSETWLLKTCGDIHWAILSSIFDEKSSSFRDVDGNRIYPAFRSVEISQASLFKAQEDDTILIQSHIEKISNTQIYSRHEISLEYDVIVVVEMISVFLARRVEHENKSVVRVKLKTDKKHSINTGDFSLFKKTQKINDIKDTINPEYFDLGKNDVFTPNTYFPCPNIHFNGAKFMYFAMFHTFVDQLEWENLNGRKIPQTNHRETYYYGNINLGDKIFVRCSGFKKNSNQIKHWCEIFRDDNTKIADIFTTKILL